MKRFTILTWILLVPFALGDSGVLFKLRYFSIQGVKGEFRSLLFKLVCHGLVGHVPQ